MPQPRLPDPVAVARQEAERIGRNRERMLDAPLQRALSDCPFVERESLLEGLDAFHRERMDRVPSHTTYPEAQPWVEHALAVDRHLREMTGLSNRQMAVLRSLAAYLTFRGYGNAAPASSERCRVVYLPHSDRGRFHVKNVDDPLTYWRPNPNPCGPPIFGPLVLDGVGAGLHLDHEPPEIFPLPVRDMLRVYADDVPGAVQFLRRYSYFWGSQNIVLHDGEEHSVAIEKSSYNFMDVYGPEESGGSHVSGMVCREPKTEQGRYVTRQRQRYLQLFGQPADGPDSAFWRACDRAEAMLSALMSRPDPKVEQFLALLTTPWPEGLNKDGAKFHPDQAYVQYTLITLAQLPDAGQVLRWQRSTDGIYPSVPQVFEFSPTSAR